MRFHFNEDHLLFQSTVRDFLAKECTPEHIRSVWEGETAHSPKLWSMLAELGIAGSPADCVRRYARLAKDCGLDGVVCSPLEASLLRAELGSEFVLVTPGVRPAGADKGDQRRVMAPADAVAAGSERQLHAALLSG